MDCIRNGESLRSVSRKYGIPAKTLFRYRNQTISSPGEIKLGRFTSDIDPKNEIRLVKKIEVNGKCLFGLSPVHIRRGEAWLTAQIQS